MFNTQHLNVRREYEWALNYEDATFSRAIAQDLIMNIERNKTVRKEVPDKEVKE